MASSLGREENPLPITVAQGLSHADFTGTLTIVPAVFHEGDALSNRSPDNLNARSFVTLFADVQSTQSYGRYFLGRPAQDALGQYAH